MTFDCMGAFGSRVMKTLSSQVHLQSIHFTNCIHTEGAVLLLLQSDCIISRCLLTDNFALSNGGGISATSSSVRVKQSQFLRNVASFGGSIYSTRELFIHQSQFSGNTAQNGGSVYCIGVCNLLDSLFTIGFGNFGGFVSSLNAELFISYCEFDGGSASDFGGALGIVSSNCIIEHSGTVNITFFHCLIL